MVRFGPARKSLRPPGAPPPALWGFAGPGPVVRGRAIATVIEPMCANTCHHHHTGRTGPALVSGNHGRSSRPGGGSSSPSYILLERSLETAETSHLAGRGGTKAIAIYRPLAGSVVPSLIGLANHHLPTFYIALTCRGMRVSARTAEQLPAVGVGKA